MATHIRCYACGGFFSIKDNGCPDCDAPRRTRNGYLEKAQLNEHLYAQAETAANEEKRQYAVARGAEPSSWAKEQARQMMERM